MGGQDGNRGYLLQAIIAVLQALTKKEWVDIAIEPDENNQKVDIQCWDEKGRETVTQVKSSINNFDKAEILRITADLIGDAPAAVQYIVTFIGSYSAETKKFFNALRTQEKAAFGTYTSVFDQRDKVLMDLKALDLPALDGLLESKIHAFLSDKGYVVHHQVINLIALGLQAQFSRFATNGEKISRNDLEDQLITWMKFNYPKELRRDSERLGLNFYHNHQLIPSVSFAERLKLPQSILDDRLAEIIHQACDLVEQIDSIKLAKTLLTDEEDKHLSRLQEIFGPYGKMSAAFQEDEIKVIREQALKLLKLALPEDFFHVGQVKKVEMDSATLFIGGGPKFTGTENEKAKREALSDLVYELNRLQDLTDCRDALCSFRLLPLVIVNEGDTLQSNIELQLQVPKKLKVLTAASFPQPGYNQNQKFWTYDEGVAQKLFTIPPSSKVQDYDYRNMVPINFPDISPFMGKRYQHGMEQNLKWVFDYKVYDDEPEYATISCLFKNLKPSSAMALPSYIFVKADEPFELTYRIKSDQSGNSNGTIKIL